MISRNPGGRPVVSSFFAKPVVQPSDRLVRYLKKIKGERPVRAPRFSPPGHFSHARRPMPISPHRLVEEELSSNPWALLVAAVFLNRTSGKAARPYINEFFAEYPNPPSVIASSPASLEKFFRHLGIRRRARTIWKLSYEFETKPWVRPDELYGVGKYGSDVFSIFWLGDVDVQPQDRFLKLYVEWYCRVWRGKR